MMEMMDTGTNRTKNSSKVIEWVLEMDLVLQPNLRLRKSSRILVIPDL